MSHLKEMPSKWITQHLISFSAAISARREGKQLEKALPHLQEMPAKWITPNLIRFRAAISTRREGKQLENYNERLEALIIVFSTPASGKELWKEL